MGLIQIFGPAGGICRVFFFFFCDSKSNKIGISLHAEVLPLLNLLSAAPGSSAVPAVLPGETQLPSLAPRRSDLVCPDAEHAAAAGGASCEAAAKHMG